jgi:hypothetical protein
MTSVSTIAIVSEPFTAVRGPPSFKSFKSFNSYSMVTPVWQFRNDGMIRTYDMLPIQVARNSRGLCDLDLNVLVLVFVNVRMSCTAAIWAINNDLRMIRALVLSIFCIFGVGHPSCHAVVNVWSTT